MSNLRPSVEDGGGGDTVVTPYLPISDSIENGYGADKSEIKQGELYLLLSGTHPFLYSV